jgi:hypothetical protein
MLAKRGEKKSLPAPTATTDKLETTHA